MRGLFRDDRRPSVCIGGWRRQLGADCAGLAGGAFSRGADSAMTGCDARLHEEGGASVAPIRLILPQHLRTLSGVEGEVRLDVDAPVTVRRARWSEEGRVGEE